MATIKSDIVNGNQGRYGTRGWELDRVIVVSNLTEANGHARLKEAVDNCGVALWATHPTVTSARAIEFRPRAISTDVVEVTVVYRTPTVHIGSIGDDAQIEVGSTMQQVDEQRDIDGTKVLVSYTLGGITYTHVPDMSVTRPSFYAHFTRRESSSPAGKAYTYVGKVNTAGWAVDPTADARTWLCTGITGRSDDGGDTFLVTYDFEYRDFTYCGNWDAYVYYRNSDGSVPEDLVWDTGEKCVIVYETVNFDPLDLPAI